MRLLGPDLLPLAIHSAALPPPQPTSHSPAKQLDFFVPTRITLHFGGSAVTTLVHKSTNAGKPVKYISVRCCSCCLHTHTRAAGVLLHVRQLLPAPLSPLHTAPTPGDAGPPILTPRRCLS